MNCRKCATPLLDGSIFCHMCGTRQSTQRTQRGRGNGQGTAYKRGSTWTAQWTEGRYLDENNKLHIVRRTKGGFKTKTAALAYAASPPATEKRKAKTLRDYYRVYEKTGLEKVGDTTKDAYRIAWRRMSPLADREISSLTIEDIQDNVNTAASTYYTAKDMKSLYSHLFNRAMADGSATVNLSKFIQLPTLEEKEGEPFTAEEVNAFWSAYGNGDDFVGYILVMIYTGMMPGELMKLEKDMIHYDTCEIIGCGAKTKKRKNTSIVFPDIIAPVLSDLSDKSQSRIGRVLCMNKDRFYAEYYKAVERAGVRPLPPYSCRHTTGTSLALSNVALSVIQEVMRHSKVSTTQRYIHPDVTATRQAVNTFAKAQEQPENA